MLVPYRAMIWTVLTVALALLLVAMWVHAIHPMLSSAMNALETQPGAASSRAVVSASGPAMVHAATTPEKDLSRLVRGTLILCFVLVGLLVVVGVAAMFREWMRACGSGSWWGHRHRTVYVDAWKIAGERMQSEGKEREGGEDKHSQ